MSNERGTKEQMRLLREAWRQLQWFELQRQRAEAAKGRGAETMPYSINTAYVLKSAEVYRAIDAALNVRAETIEVDP